MSHGGRHDITKHVTSKHHLEMAKSASSSKSICSYYKPSESQSVIEAESRWALFVSKHNLAFLNSDHATQLFTKIFKDSEIAKKFSCARTKCAAIVTDALAPYFTSKLIKNLSNPFSIMIDESNDKTDKSCIILVRVFDSEVGDIRTRFLDMPIVNIGTANNLFSALKESLHKFGLTFSRAVSFMSDTTNVMKGARSGVKKLIKDENPFLHDVGCICHLADLVVKAGMETLPIDIDQLFVDVFYHFYHSSKRKQQFTDLWQSLFTSEPEVILKHSTTRWLSLLRCVRRYINQYEGLKSYFLTCDNRTNKVESITARLEDPLVLPLLYFLSYILPHIDRFNCIFQKSYQNTTCQLYVEINRLVKLYAANLLTSASIQASGTNLKNLKFDSQLENEHLGIGTETWAAISVFEQERNTKPFFEAVRKFYVTSIKKMIQKFPFGDSLFRDLEILLPTKLTSTTTISIALKLAERFPQLEISDTFSLDKLREECLDYTLSSADLPTPDMYTAADGIERPQIGRYWRKVSQLLTLDRQPRFPLLYKLMIGLMTIPASNADAERGFSMLRKIHTDQRSNLSQSTITALMSIKLNCEDCCIDTELPNDLLLDCKKATSKVVKRSQAINN